MYPLVPGTLHAAIHALITGLRPAADPELADALNRVLGRLRAPPEVVVTGAVSAGKSTLVNALIGRAVAPTGPAGSTRFVVRYTAGAADRVDVVCHDGAVRSSASLGGDVLARAGLTHAQVSHLEVTLASDLLGELTIIDTPGLGSAVPPAHPLVANADAAVQVSAAPARHGEREVSTAPGPAVVLGVLTKTDLLDPGTDGSVRAAGVRLARERARELRAHSVDVLPVVGLLAQTCACSEFTDADADAIRLLAGVDEATRTAMLAAPDLFRTVAGGPSTAVRTRLLERLDLYGVACALRVVDADPGISAARIRAALYAASGAGALRETLRHEVRLCAGVVIAGSALRELELIAPLQAALRDGVETIRRLPAAHAVHLTDTLAELRSGALTLPDELAEEARRLGGAGAPAARLNLPGAPAPELAAHSLARARWWRSFAVAGANPSQAQAAHVVHRAYFLLWNELGARP